MNELELELLNHIIEELDLDDVEAGEVTPEAPLYGFDDGGLGLDSIDFLEVAVLVNKFYGVEITEGNEKNKEIFANLRALAAYVSEHRTK